MVKGGKEREFGHLSSVCAFFQAMCVCCNHFVGRTMGSVGPATGASAFLMNRPGRDLSGKQQAA